MKGVKLSFFPINFMKYKIPIIDLFAGPGGLAEGFSSVQNNQYSAFDIRLSIEKDVSAHKTLILRSFVRQFEKGKLPDEYYKVLREPDIIKREKLNKALFEKFSDEYKTASKEAWLAELGNEQFPPQLVDKRIKKGLKNVKYWALIGGPPCQAYSLVGRSRVGGIDNGDHRVYLYKEYLRIIAKHQPAVFVMENVKGLLSAKVNDEKVFHSILRDLQDPSSVFKEASATKYRIYSLSNEPDGLDIFGNPNYRDDKEYLIKSENYGIPQNRHRVILLGIREDIDIKPRTLTSLSAGIKLKDVIGDLPKIRSGLNRSFVSSEIINKKKKRYYKKEIDSNQNWEKIINSFRKEVISWNGFAKNYSDTKIGASKNSIGSEFIKCRTPSNKNPLYSWYHDPLLKGVCNHQSRSHLIQDLKRYMFAGMFAKTYKRFPRLHEYEKHGEELLPDHKNVETGKFADRFRVQLPDVPATTITSHISKDGHYFIHYDADQCRSLTVREAARIQTFPDNYLFCGSRTQQYHQVGNAVPPYLAKQIAEVVYELFNKMEI